MALIDSLISYWKMDEASGDALDAHSTNDLTDTNTVAAGTGIINGARDFESGNSEYFTHADNAELSTGDIDFTLQVWINFESLGADRCIVAKYSDAGAEYILWYDSGTQLLTWYVYKQGGGVTTVTASTFSTPPTATWILVHAWHDSVNNLIGISVNAGSANTAAATIGPDDTDKPFWIGSLNSGGGTWFMDGLIDEVGFWKRMLTSGERTELYNAGAGLAYPFAAAGGGFGQPLGGRRNNPVEMMG